MNYQFTDSTNTVVAKIDDDGKSRVSFLADAEGSYQNEYKAWVAEGNTPNPYVPPPEPAPLTPQEKLAAAGLSVDELKTLLGIS
jgi:hypothetical protein